MYPDEPWNVAKGSEPSPPSDMSAALVMLRLDRLLVDIYAAYDRYEARLARARIVTVVALVGFAAVVIGTSWSRSGLYALVIVAGFAVWYGLAERTVLLHRYFRRRTVSLWPNQGETLK